MAEALGTIITKLLINRIIQAIFYFCAFYIRQITRGDKYSPTATCSRSAHRKKHKDKTVIFPIFCNKSQTPFAFTCSPGPRRVIPTIPTGCVPTNRSWCCPRVRGEMKFKTNAHFKGCKDARWRLRKDYEKRCIANSTRWLQPAFYNTVADED